MRIQFDTNLDELVDVNYRFAMNSAAARKMRGRSIAWAGVAFALSLAAVAIFVSSIPVSRALLPMTGIATIGGIAFAFVYRRIYDRSFRQRLHKVLAEQVGDRHTWTCEIEPRSNGLWARDHGIELTLAWSDLVRVTDAEQDVEVLFRNGIVVARSRTFSSPQERAAFVAEVRTLAKGSA